MSTVARSQPLVVRVSARLSVPLPDGRRLSALTWAGAGHPLVLLHGLFDCAHGWDVFARGTHRPCVAFDLPGFGESDLPTRPRMSAYAQDIADGVAELGLVDFTLVGHSLGGGTATGVAERTPGSVSSLVLLAPCGFGRIAFADAINIPGAGLLVKATMPYALQNNWVAKGIYAAVVANGNAPDEDLLGRLQRNASSIGAGALAANRTIAAAGRAPSAYFRRRVAYDGPVRALWGERDRLVPVAHIGGLRRALPQADVTVWDGMGHHPQRERPLELSAYVVRGAIAARQERRWKRAHPEGSADAGLTSFRGRRLARRRSVRLLP